MVARDDKSFAHLQDRLCWCVWYLRDIVQVQFRQRKTMYTLNDPQRLSSSDEERHQSPVLRSEHHLKRECKYKIVLGTVGGTRVWFHVRVCRCGQYQNQEIILQTRNFTQQDGVELHYTNNCHWLRKKEHHSGNNVYKYNSHCACATLQTPYQQSDMNSKHDCIDY